MTGQIVWSPGVKLEEIERQVILTAYRHFQSNKAATAIALGIAVRTLDAKLERYEADAKAQRQRDAEAQIQQDSFMLRARGLAPSQMVSATPPLRAEPILNSPTPVPVRTGSKG